MIAAGGPGHGADDAGRDDGPSPTELRALAESAPVGMFRMDHNNVIRYMNERFHALTGAREGDPFELVPEFFDGAHFSRESSYFECSVPTESGERFMSVHLVPLDPDDISSDILGYCYDVTASTVQNDELRTQARTDPLSGLANRTALEEFIAASASNGVAVIMCDVDGFKQVNDTLGHDAGDEAIRVLAERLQSVTRPSDLVARLGGDEFVIVAPGAGTEDSAMTIAERCHPLFRLPIEFDGSFIEVSATVGVALGGTGEDPRPLLRLADHALYEAKLAGRDRVQLHRGPASDGALTPLVMRSELRNALERDELHLELQPMFRIDGTPGPVDAEALLRWNHPTFGSISPGQIIPVAEQTGMICPLGRWAARRVVEAVSELRPDAWVGIRIGVNLSAVQVADPDFIVELSRALDEFDVSAAAVPIELTESYRLHEVEGSLDNLHRLAELGCPIVLDDFGSGMASFEYLVSLPIDVVKVDQAFIHQSTTERGFTMLQSFTDACHELGIVVVAEGVENAKQLEAVQLAGIERAQGFYFAKPVLPEDLIDAVTHGRSLLAGDRAA